MSSIAKCAYGYDWMLVPAATDSGRVEMTKDERALSLLKRSVEEAAYFVTVHFGSRMGLPFPKSVLRMLPWGLCCFHNSAPLKSNRILCPSWIRSRIYVSERWSLFTQQHHLSPIKSGHWGQWEDETYQHHQPTALYMQFLILVSQPNAIQMFEALTSL